MQSIRYKIGFGHFSLAAIIIVLSVFVAFSFLRLNRSITPILEKNGPTAEAAQNMLKALDDQVQYQILMLQGDVDLAYAGYRSSRDRFLNWYQRALSARLPAPEGMVLDSIIVTYKAYLTNSEAFYRLCRTESPLARPFHMESLVPMEQRLRRQCLRVIENNQHLITQTTILAKRTADRTMVMLALAAGLSIFFALWANAQVSRNVVRPAIKLAHSIRLISRGQLNQKIDITSNDEFAEISSEFNKMTERLRTYEEMNVHQLIAEKKKSETIVTSIAEPLIVTDVGHMILLVNEAAAQMLNIPQQNIIGKPVEEVVQQRRLLQLLRADARQRRELAQSDFLFRHETSQGTLYYRPKQTVIIDESGLPQGIVTLFEDVTRFKDLDRLKTDFIATVSHEFRTPLTSINMTMDILSQQILGPITPQQEELLHNAKDDCERLTKLVKELLDISRMQSGSYQMKIAPLRLDQIIDEAVKPLRLLFHDKGIDLRIEAGDGLHFAGDAQQMNWIFSNLLNNALRHTPRGGTVTLRVRKKRHEILVSIADTGPGIPKELQQIIFDKFMQIKKEGETTPGSVGLGLAIARQAVESHGGRIRVESENGAGSTFYFTIPTTRSS